MGRRARVQRSVGFELRASGAGAAPVGLRERVQLWGLDGCSVVERAVRRVRKSRYRCVRHGPSRVVEGIAGASVQACVSTC